MYTFDKISEIPEKFRSRFTVCYMGKFIQYMIFSSPREFVRFYKNVPIENRFFYEVIRNNRRKFAVDIDKKISDDELLDITRKIEKELDSPIVLFNSSSSEKFSYHIVSLNRYYTLYECKKIINIIDPNNICDRSIYKSVQLFRIEGSTKYNQSRYKYINGYNSISDNMEDFFLYSDYFENIPKKVIIDNIKDKIKISPEIIPKCYSISKKVGNNLIHLKRIYSDYCHLCKRIHDSENAYIYTFNGKWIFRCFRKDSEK